MPRVKSIAFDRNGKPLVVSMTFPTLQVASYTLTLFEAKSNSIVLREEGNNVNLEDDNYTLPTPPATNNGRLLEFDVTFVDPAGKTGVTCRAVADLLQGSTKVGSLEVSGTLDGQSLSGMDFAKLTC